MKAAVMIQSSVNLSELQHIPEPESYVPTPNDLAMHTLEYTRRANETAHITTNGMDTPIAKSTRLTAIITT